LYYYSKSSEPAMYLACNSSNANTMEYNSTPKNIHKPIKLTGKSHFKKLMVYGWKGMEYRWSSKSTPLNVSARNNML